MCYDNYMTIIKCIRCKLSKPDTEYRFYHGKFNKHCNDCRKLNNEWYAKDKNGKRTKARAYYYSMKDRFAQYRSDLRLDRKYSLTRERWNEMLKKQDNKCGICGIDFKDKKPCVDHCHVTQKIRGLLCRKCNLDLQAIEDTEFLRKAQIYLSQ